MKQLRARKFAPKAKQEEFFQLVAVSLQASFQGPLQRPDLISSDRAELTFLLSSLLHEAREVAARIPAHLAVIDAAKDYIAYATDGGPHWDEPPKRLVPAPWMKLTENLQVQGIFSGVLEEIDGRWQAVNPEWDGLPYNESATLRLLVHLRHVGSAGRSDLDRVLRRFGGGDIEKALSGPELERWVVRSDDGDERIWTATRKLKQDVPMAPEESDETTHLTWGKLRRPLPSEAELILNHLQTHGSGLKRDFRAFLPNLSADAMGRRLRQLESMGAIHAVGHTWFSGPLPLGVVGRKKRRARTREGSTARSDGAHLTPIGKRLLKAFRLAGTVSLPFLQNVVPDADRGELLGMLSRLCDAGWVANRGGPINGEWWTTVQPDKPPAVPAPEDTPIKTDESDVDASTPSFPPKRKFKPELAAELDRIEAYVQKHPGVPMRTVRTLLGYDNSVSRFHNLVEKLYAARRVYKRKTSVFPGKDPAWAR